MRSEKSRTSGFPPSVFDTVSASITSLPDARASLASIFAAPGAIAAPVIGIDTTSGFINYVVVGFVWKTLIEVVLLPITSTVIKLVKKREDYRAFDAA